MTIVALRMALVMMLIISAGTLCHADGWFDEDHDVMLLPVAMYSTDTGFGGGFAGFKTYNPDRVRTSSVQTIFIYTEKKQITTAFNWDHYFTNGRDRITFETGYRKFPTDFYGLGNNTSNDDPGNFTPETFETELTYERRFMHGIRVKTELMFKNQTLVEEDPDGVLELSGVPWSKGRLDFGAGLALLWDSRDNTFATTEGTFAQLRYKGNLFQDEGGAYNTISLDIRHFMSPFHDIVFASMAWIKDARGDVPFYILPELGGYDRLRGYENERFRDRSLILVQQDVRFPIWGPIGAAVFGATGRVADDIGSLTSGTYHTSWGGGLRYFFNRKENMLVRGDYARSDDSTGFYLTFAEAF